VIRQLDWRALAAQGLRVCTSCENLTGFVRYAGV